MTVPVKGPMDAMGAESGMPIYLGTIDATTTSKTNGTGGATTPFNASGDLLEGKVLLVYNEGLTDARVYPITTSTGAAGTVSNARGAGFGVPIHSGERVTIRMGPGYGYIAAIMTSGTGNIDVWELI